MTPTRLLIALAAVAVSGACGAADLARPDDALVRRLEANPTELAARITECQKMSLADAVGSTVCVSTQEVRYRRERASLRTTTTTNGSPAAARPQVVAQNVATEAR